MFLSSFRSPSSLFEVSYLPTNLTSINYRFLPLNRAFLQGIQNSIIVAGVVLALTLGFGALAAYALGRLKFRGQRLIRYAVLAMTAFPQIAIVGGLYTIIVNPCAILRSDCRDFGLYNTLTALILSYLILTLPLVIWFLTTYYKNLPQELEDAAYVDGATPLQTFYYIFLPLAIPGLIITGLLSFIVAWNEFLFALTFTLDESSRTAPVAISFFGTRGQGILSTLAASTMVTLPVILLAIIFQRQITVGLTGLSLPKEPATNRWFNQQLSRFGIPPLDVPSKILLTISALILIAFVHYGWSAITFPYPLDYAEGPLLDQLVRLARFENIYRPDISQPPYTIANYPPLYLLVQLPFMWLFGPMFWYGRVISWFSIVASAVLVTLILQTLTQDRLAALIGGLTLIAIPYISFWAPLFRIDSLALALSLAALLIIVRWPNQRWSLIATAVLLTAAVYTRQSYGLAAPFAAFIWLLSQRPRQRAFILTLLVGTLGLGLFAILNGLTQGGFYFNIVQANINEFSFDLLEEFFAEFWLFLPYLIIGSGIFVIGAGWARQKSWWLLAPYLIAAALASLTIGKVGSNVNYFLELSAAMSLVIGALIAWQRKRPLIRATLLLILALQFYLILPGAPNHLFTQFRMEQPITQRDLLQTIETADGPVLVDEFMGMLPLVDQSIYIQPFEVTQLYQAGLWDQAPFLDAIKQQEFELVIIFKVRGPNGWLQDERWTPEMLNHFDTYYEPIKVIDNTIFISRPKGEVVSTTQ